MLRVIVVPLDGSVNSERAIPVARQVARRCNASIELLTVLPVALWTARVDEATRYLERRVRDHGLEGARLTVVTDRPVEDVILEAARREEALVCMSSHGRTGLVELLLGSTAAAVVRDSVRPVLVVGPRCDEPRDVSGGSDDRGRRQ